VNVPIDQQPTLILKAPGSKESIQELNGFTIYRLDFRGKIRGVPYNSTCAVDWAGYIPRQAHGQSFRAVAKMLMTHSYKAWRPVTTRALSTVGTLAILMG